MSFSRSHKISVALLLGACLSPMANAGNYPAHDPSLVPSNPQVGECYARVKIPAQFSEDRQNVVTSQGYDNIEVEPARIESRQEQVLTKEASVRYEVTQPSYRTISEQRLTRPAYEQLVLTPPQFKTVREQVRVSAPRTVWKLGNPGALAAQGYNVLSTADGRTGRSTGGNGYATGAGEGYGIGATRCGAGCEIWCLVEEPGESVSYDRNILASPAEVTRALVPARYTNISRQVVADPGGVREIPVPAEYTAITVEDVVAPARARAVHVPATYGSIATKVLTSPERYEWRRVVCQPGTYDYGQNSGQSGPALSNSGAEYGASSQSSSTSYGAVTDGYATTASYDYQSGGQSTAYGSETTYGTADSYGNESTYSGATTGSYGSTGSYGYEDTVSSQGYEPSSPERPGGIYYYGTNQPVH